MSEQVNRSADFWMARALALARGYDPAPNPRVGAVVVAGDGGTARVVGEGAHVRAGFPHAEVVALDGAGDRARGATLYVTLEPCCHTGGGKRTPPCTQRIIAAGIARVVVASRDPNPRVNGGGAAALRAAGIEVRCGVLAAREREMNGEYHHFRKVGRPWVTVKQAVTIDGVIAPYKGCGARLSSDAGRAWVHETRRRYQAIAVGGATVRVDNPRLTVRMDGVDESADAGGERGGPQRVIFAGEGAIDANSRLFAPSLDGRPVFGVRALNRIPPMAGVGARGV